LSGEKNIIGGRNHSNNLMTSHSFIDLKVFQEIIIIKIRQLFFLASIFQTLTPLAFLSILYNTYATFNYHRNVKNFMKNLKII